MQLLSAGAFGFMLLLFPLEMLFPLFGFPLLFLLVLLSLLFVVALAVALIAIWRSVSEVFDVSAESGRAMGSGAVSCEEREMLSMRGKCMILLVNCRHLSERPV
jgi:hypothetical protein